MNDTENNEDAQSSTYYAIPYLYKTYLRKYPPLAKELEYELIEKSNSGDKEARDLMIKSNISLVISVAKKFTGRGVPLEDLIEEGNIGLIKAIGKFNPERGYRFSTCAVWWIRQSIQRGILNLYNLIKIPLHKYEIYCDILKSKAAFEADNEKEADIEEIAEQSGINRIKVEKIINLIPRISSIDSFVSDNTENDNLALSEVIGDDEEKTSPVSIICNNENLTLLDKWLSSLDEKERLVIILRYGLYEDGEPLTLQNIAAIFKLTPESIRQLEMKAMIKLRKMANNKI
jgi:RNA polymerase nonessential primary-like sigma factor